MNLVLSGNLFALDKKCKKYLDDLKSFDFGVNLSKRYATINKISSDFSSYLNVSSGM